MRGRGPTNGLAPAATTACSSDSALLRAGISAAPSGARSALTAELSAAARVRPAKSGSAPGCATAVAGVATPADGVTADGVPVVGVASARGCSGSSPGSTSSTWRPAGSGAVSAEPLRGPAFSERTRTSTPSESPTQSGAVEPRTVPDSRSGLPASAAWSVLCVSSDCQPDQRVVPVARVRTWTVPWSSASASSQTTPTREKRWESRRRRPRAASGCRDSVGSPVARGSAPVSGRRGSDWVEPAGSPGDAAGACATGARAGAGAAGAGAASGRVSAVAQVTPIEVARSARIQEIIGRVRHVRLLE